MRRTPFALAVLLSIGSALVACDAILGIDEFPDLPLDASAVDSGADVTSDATVDDASDASVDHAQPNLDAGDAADAADEPPVCASCSAGATRCVGAGSLETCVESDAGCAQWMSSTCGSGSTCWGVPNQAYCCSGPAGECAPSCHVVEVGNADGGNGQTNCGPQGDERCCTSLVVDGGTFLRSYDGVRNTDESAPATVSTFALDKYEVTVGRFRSFLRATVPSGWTPAPGSGVHTHLNGGKGLVDSSGDGGAYEPGWQPSFTGYVQMNQDGWDETLQCAVSYGTDTWTTSPGKFEAYPVNCVTWEAAYAFCIWDGGFLPSEAEWNYAASGGSEQRSYAWSSPPTSTTVDCTYANYRGPCVGGPTLVGIEPNGNGKYGQADLTGNIYEWTLDYFAPYVSPCVDCGYLTNSPAANGRTIRGADFSYVASGIFVATRDNDPDTVLYADDGFRCARPP